MSERVLTHTHTHSIATPTCVPLVCTAEGAIVFFVPVSWLGLRGVRVMGIPIMQMWVACVFGVATVLCSDGLRAQVTSSDVSPQIQVIVDRVGNDPHLKGNMGPRIVLAAPWKKTQRQEWVGVHQGPTGDYSNGLWVIYHRDSQTLAGGSYCIGVGHAWDESLTDVTSISHTGGFTMEVWRYTGTKRGDVEMSGQMNIAGLAIVVDNSGAAAALGEVVFEATGFQTKTRTLTTSGGQSSEGQLGSISAPGLSLNLPVGTGEASYICYPQILGFGGIAEVASYTVTHSTQAYIKVWANGTPPVGHGESKALMAGFVDSTSVLGERDPPQ